MDFATVQKILLDLPRTFLRPGAPFTQLIDSFTAGAALYTNAADGISLQTDFTQVQGGWLDFWGLLFGVPRESYEADSSYRNRIVFTVTSGNGTVLGIQLWVLIVWKVIAQVTERSPVGYNIVFPATVTLAQIEQIIASIAKVRPAGVPFGVFQQGVGTFLQTINFLNAPRVTGAFLSGGSGAAQAITIPAATNNAQPLIPDLYLTDPTLNPP